MTRLPRFALLALAGIGTILLPLGALAQPQPAGAARYEILAIDVEGGSEATSGDFVRQYSGLRVGQQVALPYDPALAEATKKLYRTGFFSDVEIVADRILGDGVYLLVRVQEEPRLNQYTLENVSGGDRDDLEEQIPLLRGRPVRPSDIGRAVHAIERFYVDKGYRDVRVDVARAGAADNRVDLTFTVQRGERLEVKDVAFVGNEAFSDATLRKRLKNTPEDRWWRFWKRETFDEEAFDEDLQNLVRFYNDRGYYDARVVRDTFYVREGPDGEAEGIVVQVEVHEGDRYYVRGVAFEGNTVFTDAQLRAALGFERGDVYDRTRLERNLYYTTEHTDVASLYTDRGYLRFNVVETVTEAPGDSLDLHFEIEEGEVYTFGDVAIRGNTRTRDDVVRRELRTVPGQVYSRQALERSVRELLQLNYFDQTSLAAGPAINVDDEDKRVGLTYNLVEASSDQLELSGGWGGSLGLQLSARVTFNNFAAQDLFKGEAWRPLPSGRGQQLSLGVTTYGTRSQQFSLSFTEPWFRGRRTPAGFAVSYARYDYTDVDLSSLSSRVFYRQTLRWPDDFFQTGTDLGYRLYDVGETTSTLGLPTGISQELTLRQTLSRNSLDNPTFPQAGSSLTLGVTVAPPIPGFLQYHKWELDNQWYTPLVGRLSFSFRSQFGYIGSFTSDDVQFQRYLVGGSPLETQGRSVGFGKDLVFLRGYPVQAITPIENGEAVGGRVLNKYSAELRLFALQSPQLSFAPYLFADAANTWDSFRDYDPGRLYRAAGVGARVLLPFLGMVDVNYGYQIDPFVNTAGDVVEPGWRFQFSLGGQ